MNKDFNINILNRNSSKKVISRGEIKETIKISNRLNKGEIIIPKGTKGWLEWDGQRFVFEFDESFKYSQWHGSLYRFDYYKNARKMKNQIKCYEASNDERIEYLVRNINIERRIHGLKEINPCNIRFALNIALKNTLDLEVAIQTYLDDIELQVCSI